MKCLVSMMFAISLVSLSALGAPPAGQYEIEWEDGLCWLQANEAPVNDILAEVEAATGIPIFVDPADTSTITVRLEGRDLETLMRAIASGSSITYAQDEETGEYYIESILATTSVDLATKERIARQLVIQSKQLDEKMPEGLNRPVKYSGIGARVLLSEDKQGVWLRPLSAKSAAHKAGIQVGDLVTAIDGKAVVDFKDLREIVEAIRGPVGTSVALRMRLPDGTDTVKYVRREMFDYRPPVRP